MTADQPDDSDKIVLYEHFLPGAIIDAPGWLVVTTDEHFNVIRAQTCDRLPYIRLSDS